MRFYPRFLVLWSQVIAASTKIVTLSGHLSFCSLVCGAVFLRVKLITGLRGQRIPERHLKVSVVIYSSSQM